MNQLIIFKGIVGHNKNIGQVNVTFQFELGRVHDCVVEVLNIKPTYEQCLDLITQDERLFNKIVGIGEIETEIGDDIFEHLESGRLKLKV